MTAVEQSIYKMTQISNSQILPEPQHHHRINYREPPPPPLILREALVNRFLSACSNELSFSGGAFIEACISRSALTHKVRKATTGGSQNATKEFPEQRYDKQITCNEPRMELISNTVNKHSLRRNAVIHFNVIISGAELEINYSFRHVNNSVLKIVA